MVFDCNSSGLASGGSVARRAPPSGSRLTKILSILMHSIDTQAEGGRGGRGRTHLNQKRLWTRSDARLQRDWSGQRTYGQRVDTSVHMYQTVRDQNSAYYVRFVGLITQLLLTLLQKILGLDLSGGPSLVRGGPVLRPRLSSRSQPEKAPPLWANRSSDSPPAWSSTTLHSNAINMEQRDIKSLIHHCQSGEACSSVS
ncbi:hypothetical protein WMY93_031361 [Mugilogobius chulae]|uniref:Uncharacterized protein n=1 Tax=Mugilogobius chulae TaxID=88201 RepID=A0AAW0MI00_9GOBI